MKVQVKDIITAALREGTSINLFFALKQEDGGITVKRTELEDGDTQHNLKEQFVGLLMEDFTEKKELRIAEVSGADERGDVLYHYDMKTFPESLQYFSEFDYQMDYDTFSFGEDDLIDLDAYIICIGTQENYCVLYKKFYPVFLLGRGSFCLIPSQYRFQEFEKELLRVSRDYQFIRIGEDIYIKDINVLEKFGGFRKIIEKEASEAVEIIDTLQILEDSEGLQETLMEDVAFARKLCKVKRTSPVLNLNIDNETIIKFSKTHPGLVGQLKYNAEGNRIQLTTKKSKKLFLKLLDDSYLVSQLTNLFYDSIAKEQIRDV